MNYANYVENILRDSEIKKNEIFDFAGHHLESVYQDFFDFCVLNGERDIKYFGIAPTYFFFSIGEAANGKAKWLGRCGVITLTKGFIEQLFEKINQKRFFESNAELNEYAILQEQLPNRLENIMFDTAAIFGYYHEFAHVVQSHPSSHEVSEYYAGYVEYNHDSHIREYDADLWGTNLVSNHIEDYIERFFPKELQNDEQKRNLHYLAIASIITTMVLMLNLELDSYDKPLDDFRRLYFKEKRHPHFVVRVHYIVYQYIFNVQQFVNLEPATTMMAVGRICNEYFDDSQIFKDFMEDWIHHFQKIDDYSLGLEADALKMKNLIRHRFAEG